jgi:Zonular occludens toxin (Zot)
MASIRFITAPIRSGKSLLGTKFICDELHRTERFVVTNIPIILKITREPAQTKELAQLIINELSKRTIPTGKKNEVFRDLDLYWTIQEYCHVWIDKPVNVAERVIYLSEEQTREFWRYLPKGLISDEAAQEFGVEPWRNDEDSERPSYGWKLPNMPHKQYQFVPDFRFREKFPRGCYYALDEVHQHFPSRYWQGLGPQVERYMSQLGKLNDDLDLFTQHYEKVDKNFRRNSTDWMTIENMGTKRMAMGVSLKNRFRWHWYQGSEAPTKFDKPTDSGWINIDGKRRYQWLYRTMKGVGVAGALTSEESRFKGRSPIWWVLAIAAVLVGAWFLPRAVQGAVTHVVGGLIHGTQVGFEKGVSKTVAGLNQAPAPAPPAVLPVERPHRISPRPLVPDVHWRLQSPANSTTGTAAAGDVPAPAGIECTGFFPMGTNVVVLLSDGSELRSDRGEVKGVGEKFVRVNYDGSGFCKIPVHKIRN